MEVVSNELFIPQRLIINFDDKLHGFKEIEFLINDKHYIFKIEDMLKFLAEHITHIEG